MRQATDPDLRKWVIHRGKRGEIRWYQRYLEAYWIIIGRWSLHRAWQDGLDCGASKTHRLYIPENRYAKRLATQIWAKHYKDVSPNWKVQDGTVSVLTQIDNMVTGLVRKSNE